MGILEHLRRLLSYDEWANQEVLAGLKAASPTPQRPVKLLAHIFAAERLWLERIQSTPQTLPVWPEFSLDQCSVQAQEMPMLWERFLSSVDQQGLERSITYRNTKGEPWSSKVEDIVLHVAMHSAYHRGQIASDMRAAGLTPVYTDFIHAVRQGLLE